ncbi:ABC transporter substrate-binding protein [Mangrovibacillus cuniculi]|uniref:Solute-binding protein family 5 domain-containing protein n=1 Tax=Mangrovibacillus cuniculi TaxID=2593652 RepID=A0A7S8CDY0_9BACI|nr:ABC transporter substrate-binding protein [Mangrovibacillus cuniculi]QPC48219.1 hypothetical protein G8O30_15490 [Mangrovibacillus cuniculi]
MELKLNFTQKITNLSPSYCIGTNEVNISKLLYRPLYEYENNELRMNLVVSDNHNDDFTTWTISICNFYWSDGSEGNIGDLVKTWENIIRENLQYSSYLLNIKGASEFKNQENSKIIGLKIKDTKTISIEFIVPIPYFRELLTNINLSPVKGVDNQITPYTIEDFINNKTIHTNNSYKIHSWSSKELVVKSTTKNNIYNKIHFTFSTDYNQILNRLNIGDLHIHDGGTIDGEPNARYLEKYLKYYDFLSTFYLFFNMSKEDKIPVALRRELMQVVHNDVFITGTDKVQTDALIPSGIRNWSTVSYTNDTGYKCISIEQPIVFICNDEPQYVKLSEKLINLWESRLQVRFKLEIYSWDEFVIKLSNGSYDIARAGWVADFPHPHSFYEVLLSDSESNYSKWKNEKFDNLIKESRIIEDLQIMKQKFIKADCLLKKEIPVLPIYEHKLRQLIGNNVINFDISNTGVINYKTTKLTLRGGENNEKDRSS